MCIRDRCVCARARARVRVCVCVFCLCVYFFLSFFVCLATLGDQEAMKEADVNHSRSLDFYEYVLVADKLIHRTGELPPFLH